MPVLALPSDGPMLFPIPFPFPFPALVRREEVVSLVSLVILAAAVAAAAVVDDVAAVVIPLPAKASSSNARWTRRNVRVSTRARRLSSSFFFSPVSVSV